MELGFFIVVLLLMLAATDLTVGVANDAVNFINSAYGSNAGSFKTILFIAAAGVFVGVLSSGGMLEVARKGVFNPGQFLMMELLTIFLAVMFQDIMLIDIFNTYGLPTSTTVSIVFGLMGGALAMSITKLNAAGEAYNMLGQYINFQNLVRIITGIFMSIVVAFVAGSAIQYLVRLIFTFDYKKRFQKYGAIYGGLVVTALSSFILFKGAKNIDIDAVQDVIGTMKNNFWLWQVSSFIIWTTILQLFMKFTKLNILRGIVLFGTFALAMAFAANDLVNFIGAPIAGLTAFDLSDGSISTSLIGKFTALSNGNPLASMEGMNKKVPADLSLLLIAAGIMIATLFYSRKALGVVRTGIDLGKQGETREKFESNMLGRFFVKVSVDIFKYVNRIIPESTASWVRSRFDLSKYQPEVADDGREAAFDLIRASVILFVSAVIIIIATSMKLPLSTTYVTFITAMAAALPDKAWGRESAAYRVSGVITVIGGWFFTAFFASLLAFLLVLLINWGGAYAIIGVALFIVFIMIRSSKRAKKQNAEEAEYAKNLAEKSGSNVDNTDIDKFLTGMDAFMIVSVDALSTSLDGIALAKLDKLKRAKELAIQSANKADFLKMDLMNMLNSFDDADLKVTFTHSKAMITIQDIADRINDLTKRTYKYIDNRHHEFLPEQAEDLQRIRIIMNDIVNNAADMITKRDFSVDTQLKADMRVLRTIIKEANKCQIKRQASDDKSVVRRSMLYLNLLFEINVVFEDIYQIYSATKKVYKQNIKKK